MLKRFQFITTYLVMVLLSSCVSYYQPPENGVITVSFSSLSQLKPIVSVINNCQSEVISEKFIEHKKPSEKSIHTLNISESNELTFEVNYFLVSKEKTELISKRQFIEEKKMKDLSFCTDSITFIPEMNKHYEIVFDIPINGNCKINASEVQTIDGLIKQKLVDVKAIQQTECS